MSDHDLQYARHSLWPQEYNCSCGWGVGTRLGHADHVANMRLGLPDVSPQDFGWGFFETGGHNMEFFTQPTGFVVNQDAEDNYYDDGDSDGWIEDADYDEDETPNVQAQQVAGVGPAWGNWLEANRAAGTLPRPITWSPSGFSVDPPSASPWNTPHVFVPANGGTITVTQNALTGQHSVSYVGVTFDGTWEPEFRRQFPDIHLDGTPRET